MRGGPHPLPPLAAPRHNLPIQLTSFIGREEAMAQVKQFLATTRLLTLTGSGGCGKTRLALQVGADLLEAYAEGVWLVELAALADPSLVPQTVAAALGVREEAGRPLTETLVDYLKSKALLLLLDNCEHLVAACATLAEALLRRCPCLRVLATSREGLGIGGEQTYRVPPLSLPDARQLLALERLCGFEAVLLFADRARLGQATFTVTEANAPAVAQVCRRLDGIPLAIELAAARVKALPVEQIQARLDDRFRLLTGGSRTAPPRQQTLRALIDWSYDLLSEPEQALLRRLSVFAGGWTLEAAEGVCSGEEIEAREVVDGLAALVAKSLVQYEASSDEARYRMLETVREYAWEKLAGSGEGTAVRNQHRDWYLQLAVQADGAGLGPEAELDNFRAALAWCFEAVDSGRSTAAAEVGLRLAYSLLWLWMSRGHLAEGQQWLEGALARSPEAPAPLRAAALLRTAHLANTRGDRDRRLAFLEAARGEEERAMALARREGDRPGVASALVLLAEVAAAGGDLDTAWNLCIEARQLFEEPGDPLGLLSSGALEWLARIALQRRDCRAARPLLEEWLAIGRKLGGPGDLMHALGGMGHLERDEGNYARAGAFYRESLLLRQEFGNQIALAQSLEDLAVLAGRERHAERAIRLLGAGEALCETLGARPPVAVAEEYERTVAEGRAALGEAAFLTAWAEGRAMSLDEAVAFALQERPDS